MLKFTHIFYTKISLFSNAKCEKVILPSVTTDSVSESSKLLLKVCRSGSPNPGCSDKPAETAL